MADYYAAVSQKGLQGPDGKIRHYAAGTIEKWYLSSSLMRPTTSAMLS